MAPPPATMRGITLLIAVIFAGVVLTVGLTLLDISYKQVILSSSAKESQSAFYNADAAMECALYWDQQKNAFSYAASSYLTSGISCANDAGVSESILFPPNTSAVSGSVRTTTFSIDCKNGGSDATVRVDKDSSGNTTIFATGYSSCDSTDPKRTERGLKSTYAGTASVGGSGSGGTGTLSFSISPALGGKTTWTPSTDGALVFPSSGAWTLTAAGSGTLTAKLWGAGGGGGHPSRTKTANGGGGGFVSGSLTIASGDSLAVTVGGGGSGQGTGGAYGGGNGLSNGAYGGGGGGTSLLMDGTLELDAAGGGGGGYDYPGCAGGAPTGQRCVGDGGGGYGGTATAGGAGGGTSPVGKPGSYGQGGDSTYYGGGGGGGYYGGGGAGSVSGYGNGGGGGSSYYSGPAVTNGATEGGSVQMPGGTGDPDYQGNAGEGGAGATSGYGSAGNPGMVILK